MGISKISWVSEILKVLMGLTGSFLALRSCEIQHKRWNDAWNEVLILFVGENDAVQIKVLKIMFYIMYSLYVIIEATSPSNLIYFSYTTLW